MSKLPTHIAFIMDGNGRWATAQGKPRNFGHQKGADALVEIVRHGFDSGVKVMSFYAFSTENWARPEDEVKKIISLLTLMLDKYLPVLIEKQIKLVVSGDVSPLSRQRRVKVERAIEKTEKFDGPVLNICFNYGGHAEILRAVNSIIADGEKTVTEEVFEKYLYTKDLPPVDLVIRTSGEMRLSNFLLWQAAYAELYFTDVLWPDFSAEQFDIAIDWFATRKRRFGKVDS